MRRLLLIFGGVLLVVTAACGVTRSVRAALAQSIYYRTKFGSLSGQFEPEEVERRCLAANRLYRHNYYFSILTAEACYYGRFDRVTGEDKPGRVEIANYWCDAGLRLNNYQQPLRRLKARLLARTSPAEAVAYWRAYVDWHFWEPQNHAVLAELYAGAGDLDGAVAELYWTRGTEHEATARRAIDEAWRRERALPAL